MKQYSFLKEAPSYMAQKTRDAVSKLQQQVRRSPTKTVSADKIYQTKQQIGMNDVQKLA